MNKNPPQIDYTFPLTFDDLKRIYSQLEKMLRDKGVENYFDWFAAIKKYNGAHADYIVKCLASIDEEMRKMEQGNGDGSKTLNKMQDWYVFCLELQEELKERGLI